MEIIADNISKSFFITKNVETKALRDVSFTIKHGERVAVMGPSGAGKSTLLHLIGLMDRPTSGRIVLGGKDISGLSDKDFTDIRKNKIGFLFQMHYLLPDFTVAENIRIPVWEYKHSKNTEVTDLLERLGISQRADHFPSEISGGEQQRVALARALISNPSTLLCDEPTGDLDRETGQMVEEIIFEECKKRNMSLVVVTHNPDLADKADRIIRMKDGRIIN